MSLRALPELQPFNFNSAPVNWQMREDALARWSNTVIAKDDDGVAVIDILDVIGYDWWSGGGVTSDGVRDQLRAIGNNPVIVNINSPGGDFFEGVAIYNLLRAHKGKVTVRILATAASAASVIAMAADELHMSKASWLMIHNTWVCVAGNRHDLTAAADTMTKFDAALAEVYADRSGQDLETVVAWLDKETWFGGSEAIELGFADGLIDDSDLAVRAETEKDREIKAEIQIDAALRAQNPKGSRNERRKLIAACKTGKPGAAQNSKNNADVMAAAQSLLKTLKG